MLQRKFSVDKEQPNIDITSGGVQLQIGKSPWGKRVLWVNVDGICVLRVNDCTSFDIKLDKLLHESITSEDRKDKFLSGAEDIDIIRTGIDDR